MTMNPRLPAPRFELTQLLDDGSSRAALVPVFDLPAETQTHRRGFLGAAVSVGTALAAIGCGSPPAKTGGAAAAKPRQLDPAQAKWDCTGARAHRSAIHALTLSADGARLASIGADRRLKLWRAPEWSLERVITLSRFVRTTGALGFTADGGVVTESADGLEIYRAADGSWLRRLPPSDQATATTPPALSTDVSAIASVRRDGAVQVRAVADGRHIAPSVPLPSAARRLALNAGATRLAVLVGSGRILVWRLPEMTALGEPIVLPTAFNVFTATAMELSADGRALALSGQAGQVMVWAVGSTAPPLAFSAPNGSARVLAFAPDGRTLAGAGADRSVRVWDSAQGTLKATLRGHGDAVHGLAFGPDGALLFSAGGDGAIRRWRLPDGGADDCLFDLNDSPERTVGTTYEHRTEAGQTLTYTLPCGSPIPAGAVCVCNCVPGSYAAPAPMPSTGTGFSSSGPCGSPIPPGARCTCNCICTCQAVRTR